MATSKKVGDESTFIKAYDDIENPQGPLRHAEDFPLIEIVHGPKVGSWFTLAHQKEITLGRAATNSIILEDNSVSRSHAVLQFNGQEYTLRDIGSRNGTFHNKRKIQGEVPVKHLDTIKVGIYTFRFLTEPTEQSYQLKEEEVPRESETVVSKAPPAVPPDFGPTTADEAVPEEPEFEQALVETQTPEPSSVQPEAVAEEQALAVSPAVLTPAKSPSRVLRNLLFLLLVFAILGGGGYAAYRMGVVSKFKNYLNRSKVSDKQKPDQPSGSGKVVKPGPTAPAGTTIPVFIEVDAKPVAAKIFYKGKELGLTPFRISIQVPADQPQELTAEFFLEGIQQKWTEKANFQAKKQDELVPVTFQASVGKLNVKALPRNGQLYLEGKFEPGQMEPKPLSLGTINFDTPLYLPYGKYVAEIRQSQNLDASDTSSIKAVKYRREFEMSSSASEFSIDVNDETVKTYPAKITTTPTGAELLVDGKKVGETPFDGNLPTGRHRLTIKKEGFDEYEKDLTIELNTPYEANYNLSTSPAGEFINQGRTLLKKGQFNSAIEKLAEALKRNPEPTELSQIHMLLGESFLKAKTYDQAIAYYEKAKENPEYSSPAELGIASALAGQGQNDQALVKIINVVLNTKDEKLKSQAESLYNKLYPIKSVLYITTEPNGASLSINGNPIGQVTPVILSDLLVGSYRIRIDKDGYKTYESKISLSVSTIKPVVVKLDPEN